MGEGVNQWKIVPPGQMDKGQYKLSRLNACEGNICGKENPAVGQTSSIYVCSGTMTFSGFKEDIAYITKRALF